MDTRQRLIASTQELLWERGYMGTSPNAILRRAEVGQGSMYHYFTGKSDLALAALTETVRKARDEVQSKFLLPGTSMQRITGYLLSNRDVLRGCRIGRLTYDPEVLQDPFLKQPIEDLFGWQTNQLVQLLREAQRSGELDAELDPDNTAAAIAAVLQGAYVLARASDAVAPFYSAVNGILGLLRVSSSQAGRTPEESVPGRREAQEGEL